MFDLRDHKAAIVQAVAIERQNDREYSWSVKSVTKDKALIRWSYLGGNECFSIEVTTEGDGAMLNYKDPHDTFFGGYIIGGRFCDFGMDQIDEALAACVRGIARNANNLY